MKWILNFEKAWSTDLSNKYSIGKKNGIQVLSGFRCNLNKIIFSLYWYRTKTIQIRFLFLFYLYLDFFSWFFFFLQSGFRRNRSRMLWIQSLSELKIYLWIFMKPIELHKKGNKTDVRSGQEMFLRMFYNCSR